MPFEKATEEELDSIYNVHFKGVFFLTQKLLPLINDGGRIVNISTARTRIASPGGSVYASMKGALEVLSRHMAKELGPRRIAVNVVAPGATETDFSGGIVRDNPVVNKRVAEGTALGRAGVPDDIGPMIASLLSEDNHRGHGRLCLGCLYSVADDVTYAVLAVGQSDRTARSTTPLQLRHLLRLNATT
jgi:NAD(P)-dependent dehydrogenase (short-subunit alcohol dehydrogenase family)